MRNKTAPENSKTFMAFYDNEGKLVGAEMRDYIPGATTGDEQAFGVFDKDENVKKAKLYVWDISKFEPLASVMVIDNPVPAE